jgi:hypothetical protein
MHGGWAGDRPRRGRHPWLLGQATRIAAAHRNGCLSREGVGLAQRQLDARFGELCRQGIGGPPREPKPREVLDCLVTGQRYASTMGADHIASELGRHRHDVELAGGQVPRPPSQPPGVDPPTHEPVARTAAQQAEVLKATCGVFAKWLGDEYDLDALYFTLAVLAVLAVGGDPLWGLLVSGSGNAKTETVQAIFQVPNTHVVSTISSPGALLSATAKREKTADATGGLLRVIGQEGSLAIKDVTSILSMGREMRGEVLAALREVYDGYWARTVGTDGGRTLEWKGRIALIGAVTTAWDAAHSVVAAMGDRFVLLRMDSTRGRPAAGRRAIGNTGREVEMRAQLAAAVADVIVGVDASAGITLSDEDTERLLAAADLVTLARTAVEFDYRGNVDDAHAPEMPTRFAKQLGQIVRGGVAVGMSRERAMALAIRCARDSMPPLRLAIIDYLSTHPASLTAQVRKGIDKPRNTVDRQLQALHMLKVVACDEEDVTEHKTVWRYSLRADIDPAAIKVVQKCQ